MKVQRRAYSKELNVRKRPSITASRVTVLNMGTFVPVLVQGQETFSGIDKWAS